MFSIKMEPKSQLEKFLRFWVTKSCFVSMCIKVSPTFTNFHCFCEKTKGEFIQYTFFVRFFTFFLVNEKECDFSSAFFESISALTRQSHTGQKFSANFFCRGVYSSILKYRSYSQFLHKIFIYIQQSTECGYGLIKMRMKKCILFQGEGKT